VGYLDQLLPEIERIGADVAWLANLCSDATIKRLHDFPRTVSVTVMNVSFHNCLRNYPFEALEKDHDWVMQMDADETLEPNAQEKLAFALGKQPMLKMKMAHVWEADGKRYLTTDMGDEKDRLYNTTYKWRYLQKVVAGPTNFDIEVNPEQSNIWVIHWGYSTPEKRSFHKQRWDRLHGRSVGRNPYGLWSAINDPSFAPEIVPYDDFIKKL
jgi:hypothetical protein